MNPAGDFIKYHGLQANDCFFVYEDGCGNLVSSLPKKLVDTNFIAGTLTDFNGYQILLSFLRCVISAFPVTLLS